MTVGLILWDFLHLTLQFQVGDKSIKWVGMQKGQLLFMTKKQASKLTTLDGKGTCSLLLTDSSQGSLQSLQLDKEPQQYYPPDL